MSVDVRGAGGGGRWAAHANGERRDSSSDIRGSSISVVGVRRCYGVMPVVGEEASTLSSEAREWDGGQAVVEIEIVADRSRRQFPQHPI